MKKMTAHPRLYRRNATYYHRAAIPVDIKGTYPKTEETFSLKTKDYREAVRLVRIKAAEVDLRFEEHRQQIEREAGPALEILTEEHLKLIHDVYYAHLLDEDDETRIEGFEDNDDTLPETPVPTFDEYANQIEDHLQYDKALLARGKTDGFLDDEAKEILSWSNVGLKLTTGSPSWRLVKRELVKAKIRAARAKQERNTGEIIETPPTAPAPKLVSTSSTAPLLSEAVAEWAKEKTRTSWVSKTEREHRVWMKHFIETVGDKPISDYNKADAREFKAVLMKTPPNWSTKKALKGIQKLSDAAEKAHKLQITPMSISNTNKLLGFVASFWPWAEGQYDNVPENLFKGIKLQATQRVREQRDPFTTDELKVIFNAPIYTGCRSARYRWQTGRVILRDTGMFWVPLISLFTGARMGEIIQLRLEDIQQEDTIHYFNMRVEEEGQHLKTLSSWRKIPMHPQLIRMGLMDLVETRRTDKAERLFPEFKQDEHGYWSTGFSKTFSRFLTSISVKRGKNAFHSFRHNFEDVCRDSGVSGDLMDALQGHSSQGMKARYGSGFTVRKLDEAMRKIEYRNLDLSHLVVKSKE